MRAEPYAFNSPATLSALCEVLEYTSLDGGALLLLVVRFGIQCAVELKHQASVHTACAISTAGETIGESPVAASWSMHGENGEIGRTMRRRSPHARRLGEATTFPNMRDTADARSRQKRVVSQVKQLNLETLVARLGHRSSVRGPKGPTAGIRLSPPLKILEISLSS